MKTAASARGAAAGVGALLLLSGCLPCAAQPPLRRKSFRQSRAKPPRLGAGVLALAQDLQHPPRNYLVTRLRTIPHVDRPWTQGLEVYGPGQLLETSGNYPYGVGSYIRLVDRRTGDVIQRVTDGLDAPVFIEGITQQGGKWFASTYMDQKVIEYDQDLVFVREHPYPWQGWGLTRHPDGKQFIATNGSEWVMTLDGETFGLVSAQAATCQGHRVRGLNELEMVGDFFGEGPRLLGNVINTRVVLVLDPATAVCTGAFHLTDLEPETRDEANGLHVANGIAYDAATNHFFVTGKNWVSMFEISLKEDDGLNGATALEVLSRSLGTFAS